MLEKIKSPADLKTMSQAELEQVVLELRLGRLSWKRSVSTVAIMGLTLVWLR